MSFEDNCAGCRFKFKRSNFNSVSETYMSRRFNDEKWEWVCILVSPGFQIINNCPCYDCLIKIVCHSACDILKKLAESECNIIWQPKI